MLGKGNYGTIHSTQAKSTKSGSTMERKEKMQRTLLLRKCISKGCPKKTSSQLMAKYFTVKVDHHPIKTKRRNQEE